MLGDIPLMKTNDQIDNSMPVKINGSVSYVPQQAWIFNATVKENILFGLNFDSNLYERAITVAQLKKDFDTFAAGEDTEIGERGVNLSGGQKQRVSIARAVYANADLMILDDPLSALDAHVGAAVFSGLNEVLCKQMGKTIILATNQLQFASACDKIIVMDKGRIIESGTSDELLKIHDGTYKKLIASRHSDEEQKKDGKEKKAKEQGKKKKGNTDERNEKSGDGKLIQDEHRSRGSVKWSVVTNYFQAGGGLMKFMPMLLFFVLEKGFNLLRSLWISFWSENRFTDLEPVDYVIIFSAIAAAGVMFSFCANLYTTHLGLRAGKTLHNNMISKIVYAPMSFFDSTPLGRIQNRFSSDISQADNGTQFALGLFLGCAMEMVATLIIVGIQTPYSLVCFVPILTVFYYIQAYFRCSSRELTRLEALSRSPLFSHFSESLSGMSTIRAFSAEDRIENESIKRLDKLTSVSLIFTQSQLWLSLRLIALGTTCVVATGIFAVMARHTLSAQDVGLTMTYAMQITFLLQSLVNFFQQLENSFNAIERLQEYSELEVENPSDNNSNDDEDNKAWPKDGSIEVDNLTFAYRKNMEPVLKGFTVSIQNGEHIGLVGRTGCGKSTFFQALFRINDPVDGSVKINGKDFCNVGLKKLRSSIGIIPQDPVLFAGTIRTNLDPFNEFKGDSGDNKLWEALKHAHLYDAVKASGDDLDMEIQQGGENLSVGQRQLICLARALLRETKIIVLDEATANVDAETDALIQKTVRDNFADKTTLTIAHRLETIMDSDKIIVVDKGMVAEFDTPINLLKKKAGIFKSLVDDTGPNNAKYLYKIASGDEVLDLDEELTRIRRASSLDAGEALGQFDHGNYHSSFNATDRESKMISFAQNPNNVGKFLTVNGIQYELIKPAESSLNMRRPSLSLGGGNDMDSISALTPFHSMKFPGAEDLFTSGIMNSRFASLPVALFKDPNGFTVVIEIAE